MKLISLNTYGGTFYEPLIAFIKEHADSTDIFCFQEIFNDTEEKQKGRVARVNLFAELKKLLPYHIHWFAEAANNLTFTEDAKDAPGATYGLAMFINKKMAVTDEGDFFIYGQKNAFVPRDFTTLGHNAQYVTVKSGEKALTIYNLHGMSEPGNKLDTPDRIAQSKKILDHAAQLEGEKIITGDFNLLPQAKSIGMFEEAGYKNLIKDFAITSTRGTLLKKLHPEYANFPDGWQEFADYTFVTPGIKPLSYAVPDVPISDHLPLILEFEV